jgi:hypothetical protein
MPKAPRLKSWLSSPISSHMFCKYPNLTLRSRSIVFTRRNNEEVIPWLFYLPRARSSTNVVAHAMAEVLIVIGAISSVMGIAAEGLKLSSTLNSCVEKVRSAGRDIKDVVQDVKSTAVLLQQFGENLRMEKEVRLFSTEYYDELSRCAKDCQSIFKELELVFPAAINSEDPDNKISAMRGRDKLKWSFRHTKVALLRTNLDRLKLQLNTMLVVMIHKRDLYKQQSTERYVLICIYTSKNTRILTQFREKAFEVDLELKMLDLKRQDTERRYRALQNKGDDATEKRSRSKNSGNRAQGALATMPSPITEEPESHFSVPQRPPVVVIDPSGFKDDPYTQSHNDKAESPSDRIEVKIPQELIRQASP